MSDRPTIERNIELAAFGHYLRGYGRIATSTVIELNLDEPETPLSALTTFADGRQFRRYGTDLESLERGLSR